MFTDFRILFRQSYTSVLTSRRPAKFVWSSSPSYFTLLVYLELQCGESDKLWGPRARWLSLLSRRIFLQMQQNGRNPHPKFCRRAGMCSVHAWLPEEF